MGGAEQSSQSASSSTPGLLCLCPLAPRSSLCCSWDSHPHAGSPRSSAAWAVP